jgi:hypothetical protein
MLSKRSSIAIRTAVACRQMSAASPVQLQQYRKTASDRLLDHMAKVAAKAHAKGELEQSTELYEHLVSARRQRHGDIHPLTLQAICGLSHVHKDRGDLELAEVLAREATSATVETLGSKHPDALRQLSNLAAVLTRQNKFDEAEATARDALDGYRVVLGDGHADTEQAKSEHGWIVLMAQSGKQSHT